ncbi:hypothetical protein N499_0398 [Wolbachia pipientis wVitA]|nr:hypothetical protein N499_0398 [Wolbachia pipientis wVitA]
MTLYGYLDDEKRTHCPYSTGRIATFKFNQLSKRPLCKPH